MFDGLRRIRGPTDRTANDGSSGSPRDRPDALPSGSDRLEAIVEAANRVAAKIRDDAEAQARSYVEDARRRAEALTSERVGFISEASESLLEQGRMVKAQTDDLVEALREAAVGVASAASEVEPHRQPGDPIGPPDRPPAGEPPAAEPPAPEQPAGDPPARDPTPASDRKPDRDSTPAAAKAPRSREWVPAGANRGAEVGPGEPSAPLSGGAPPAAAPKADRGTSDDPRLLATRMAVAGSSPRQVEARLREVGVEDPVGLVDAVFGDV